MTRFFLFEKIPSEKSSFAFFKMFDFASRGRLLSGKALSVEPNALKYRCPLP